MVAVFIWQKKYQSKVTGITLSSKQVSISKNKACAEKIDNLTFKVEDALSLESFKDNSFDVIWSLESCEQFFDKNLFFKQAYRVLKPGGKFMLATWCSDRDEYAGKLVRDYRKLCFAFDLPYMPTIDYYRKLFAAQNFELKFSEDWSIVKKSWNLSRKKNSLTPQNIHFNLI